MKDKIISKHGEMGWEMAIKSHALIAKAMCQRELLVMCFTACIENI